MTVLRVQQVKTRKEHRCYGCARMFPAGTPMRVCAGPDGDTFMQSYWCSTCQDIGDEDGWNSGDGYGFGDMLEEAVQREASETEASK